MSTIISFSKKHENGLDCFYKKAILQAFCYKHTNPFTNIFREPICHQIKYKKLFLKRKHTTFKTNNFNLNQNVLHDFDKK